jgi:hypothetical protein
MKELCVNGCIIAEHASTEEKNDHGSVEATAYENARRNAAKNGH